MEEKDVSRSLLTAYTVTAIRKGSNPYPKKETTNILAYNKEECRQIFYINLINTLIFKEEYNQSRIGELGEGVSIIKVEDHPISKSSDIDLIGKVITEVGTQDRYVIGGWNRLINVLTRLTSQNPEFRTLRITSKMNNTTEEFYYLSGLSKIKPHSRQYIM